MLEKLRTKHEIISPTPETEKYDSDQVTLLINQILQLKPEEIQKLQDFFANRTEVEKSS